MILKDYIQQIINNHSDRNVKKCLTREYLQSRVLQIMQEKNYFNTWVFLGGTALRFLYSIPRFSEDLDFSLIKPGIDDRFSSLSKVLKTEFESEGYQIEIKQSFEKNVKSVFMKFKKILFELGVSPHQKELLSIKLEIDTNPPLGSNSERSVVQKHVLLNLNHYDKASLFAGKIHAVLTRKFTKGRDIYDLLWYLSNRSWPSPNLDFLNNALVQTNSGISHLSKNSWKKIVLEKLRSISWKTTISDVQPFLERPGEADLLRLDVFEKLLKD